MHIFHQSILFFLGASIASFLYATSLRMAANGESIMTRSRCRSCNKNLSFFQLVPVLSWIFQLGRCGCKKKILISPYYFLSEFFLGGIFIYIGQFFGMSTILLFWLIFTSILFFLFLTDFMFQLLHLPTMITGILLGLIFSIQQTLFFESFVGMVVGYFIIFIPNLIFMKIKNKKGFGDGDSYLMALIGSWLGPVITIQSLVLASWIGVVIVGVYYLFSKKIIQKLPLGALVIGSLMPLHFFIITN